MQNKTDKTLTHSPVPPTTPPRVYRSNVSPSFGPPTFDKTTKEEKILPEDIPRSREYINKPRILSNILNSIDQKEYKKESYHYVEGKKREILTIKSKYGGAVKVDYEKGKKKEIEKALLYATNWHYPHADRILGDGFVPKDIAKLIKLKKRVKKVGGVKKEIDSYDPRAIENLTRTIKTGVETLLTFKEYKILVEERGIDGRKKKRWRVLSGSSSLFDEENKQYRPNPYIMAIAFGRRLEDKKIFDDEENIIRLPLPDYFKGILLDPELKRKLKPPGIKVLLKIEEGAKWCKNKKRSFPLSVFRSYFNYSPKAERFFRLSLISILNDIKVIAGGDWWWTNQKNPSGIKSKKEPLNYILWDYTTFMLLSSSKPVKNQK